MTKIGSFFHFSKFWPEISANHTKPAPKKQKVSKKSLLGAKLTNT